MKPNTSIFSQFLEEANKQFQLGEHTPYGIVGSKEIKHDNILKVTFLSEKEVLFQFDGWGNLVNIITMD